MIYGKVNGVAAMKAIFYVHERVLQLHGPIATGILRGLACQATKKKQQQSTIAKHKHEKSAPSRALCADIKAPTPP